MVQQLRDKITIEKARQESKKHRENLNPVKKYENTREKIVQNLKSKHYWPKTMKHPEEYRGFYWTEDMAFCGFATTQNQGETINMI